MVLKAAWQTSMVVGFVWHLLQQIGMLVYTKKEEPGIKHNIDNWHVVKGKLLNNYNYSNCIATNNNCRLKEEAAAHINTFPFRKACQMDWSNHHSSVLDSKICTLLPRSWRCGTTCRISTFTMTYPFFRYASMDRFLLGTLMTVAKIW